MKYFLIIILSFVCINIGYGQKIKVSATFPITMLENYDVPHVTGYSLKGDKLEVYSLMPISGVMINNDKPTTLLEKVTNKEKGGFPLFIKNSIDINTFKSQIPEENTLIMHITTPTENTKFTLEKGTTNLVQDSIKRIVSAANLKREYKEAFPLGYISTTLYSGKYLFDSGSGEFRFNLDPTSVVVPKDIKSTLSTSPRLYAERIKNKESKISEKMHFQVVLDKVVKDTINFQFAKKYAVEMFVRDKNQNLKGMICIFRSIEVDEKEFQDSLISRVTLFYYDLKGNKKYSTDLEFTNKEHTSPFNLQRIMEDNGSLKILNLNTFVKSKIAFQYINISPQGIATIEDIKTNYYESSKTTNLNTKGRDIWFPSDLKILKTQLLKDYTFEFGYEMAAVGGYTEAGTNTTLPKSNYIKITQNDVIPVINYIYPYTANEEYNFIEGTNYFIRTVGRDDYLGEFINNAIVLTKINPNGFFRPVAKYDYSKVTQTKDKMYFVYENNTKQFVVSEVTK